MSPVTDFLPRVFRANRLKLIVGSAKCGKPIKACTFLRMCCLFDQLSAVLYPEQRRLLLQQA
jgi:hypothetical protein